MHRLCATKDKAKGREGVAKVGSVAPGNVVSRDAQRDSVVEKISSRAQAWGWNDEALATVKQRPVWNEADEGLNWLQASERGLVGRRERRERRRLLVLQGRRAFHRAAQICAMSEGGGGPEIVEAGWMAFFLAFVLGRYGDMRYGWWAVVDQHFVIFWW